MTTKIIDNEIFLKARRIKWSKVRFVFYVLIFFVVFAPPLLPIPFASPEILHDIFGGRDSILVMASGVFLFTVCLIVLFFLFLYQLVFRRRLNEIILPEITIVPLLFVLFSFLAEMFIGSVPPGIASINNGRQPEEFHNPYLGYKMLDCRNLTDEFDVIFIPRHFIETEYLAYAPRRKETRLDLPGKKYGDDWYWESSGSMWDNNLRNCRLQNKSPNK